MRLIMNLASIVTVTSVFCTSALGSEPYTRVQERPNGEIVLEMSTRTFESEDPDAPRVHLVSAIHIADADYYDAMQELLDTYDTVLYEGIKPAGLDPIDPDLDDESKVAATRERLQLLVQITRHFYQEHGYVPKGMKDLRESKDKRIVAIMNSIETDAWGNGFASNFTRNSTHETPKPYPSVSWEVSYISYGADGKQGGEGINADITESTGTIRDTEIHEDSPEGIQTQLANALRVTFQLDAMDTTNPAWVNADMDINQLQRALSEYGEDSSELLNMLDGNSFSAKLAGFILNFISRSPQLSSMMKLMLMDMLEFAEQSDLLEQQLDATHKVIVEGRNDVVIEYLHETIANHPEHKEIGIFYGAGHMVGLEEDLIEMGYTPTGDQWTQAMLVRPEETGLSKGQVKMMRNMIKSSLQQQMGR